MRDVKTTVPLGAVVFTVFEPQLSHALLAGFYLRLSRIVTAKPFPHRSGPELLRRGTGR
jgi:hypothetical protein